MVDTTVPLLCTAERKNELDIDSQQQALRAIFPRIRESSVKDLLGKQRQGYSY